MNPAYLRQLRDDLTVQKVEYETRIAHLERDLNLEHRPLGHYLDYRLLCAMIELCDQVQQLEEARHGADRHNQFDPQYAPANHEH